MQEDTTNRPTERPQNNTIGPEPYTVSQTSQITQPSQTPTSVDRQFSEPVIMSPLNPKEITADSLTGQSIKDSQKKRKRTVLIVSALTVILIASVAGSLLWRNEPAAPASISRSTPAKSQPANTAANQQAASFDTAGWKTYADPTMKLSLKYPTSISTSNSRVSLNPPEPPVNPELIQSELTVSAEIVAWDNLFKMDTAVASAILIDIVTYAPGSLNDTRNRTIPEADDITVTRDTKPMIISGTTGSCNYTTVQFNELEGTPTTKSFNCIFRKDNLVYEITGGPSASQSKKFPGVDLWALSQNVLASIQFTN
ncbi:MAG: hypothetical protein JWN75_1270 [Candidatus Saccharibacteria bacterium]|nr:hypothetical protein [Candidatus Saccharibacteria bacterium]MDB5181380.1 hypothetical protein [Candidatus Saccharibacteria bacterium]